MSILNEKKQHSPQIDPATQCLFCTETTANIESTLSHMAHAHSFFIPDIQYCINIHGLLSYYAEKLTVLNQCLYCTTAGKHFYSLTSVRKHMIEKGHTKLNDDEMEEEEEAAIVESFYDFPDHGLVRNGEVVEAYTNPSTLELVLPHVQKTLGHRSLQKYYKQRLVEQAGQEHDAMALNRVVEEYRLMGVKQLSTAEKATQRQERRSRGAWRLEIGMKSNNLQHHYRDQLLQ